MTLIEASNFKMKENGDMVVRVFLLCDTLPQILPTNGADIPDMTANMTFAPASVLYTTDSNAPYSTYIVNEAGSWVGVDGGVTISM